AAPSAATPAGSRVGRRRQAPSRLRALVGWERTRSTSSAIGCPWGAIPGIPSTERRGSRTARTRRAVGRRQAVRGTVAAIAGDGNVPAAMATEHTDELGEQPVFWHSAPGGDPPVLYVHGVPTSSTDWLSFLERTGGLAPDLPGFGRSGKRGDGDYTMAGYDRFLEAFLDHLQVERVRLVVHDWGS